MALLEVFSKWNSFGEYDDNYLISAISSRFGYNTRNMLGLNVKQKTHICNTIHTLVFSTLSSMLLYFPVHEKNLVL